MGSYVVQSGSRHCFSQGFGFALGLQGSYRKRRCGAQNLEDEDPSFRSSSKFPAALKADTSSEVSYIVRVFFIPPYRCSRQAHKIP